MSLYILSVLDIRCRFHQHIYVYKQRNPFFQVYVLRDEHGGHGLEVKQVLHVVPHAKDVIHKDHIIGMKSGQEKAMYYL